MNRFVWDMRYPGAKTLADDPSLNVFYANDQGPEAPPGTYQVWLGVGGEVYNQPFEILKDPRVSASQEELEDRFNTLIEIRDSLSETNDAIQRIRSIYRQMEEWERRAEGRTDAVAEAPDVVEAGLAAATCRHPVADPLAVLGLEVVQRGDHCSSCHARVPPDVARSRANSRWRSYSAANLGVKTRRFGLQIAVLGEWGVTTMDVNVNGQRRSLGDVDPQTPLLWVLRDELGLVGAKFGCGISQCGACTVLVDGQAVKSCSYPVSALGDAEVTTIEGLAGEKGELNALQQAWVDLDVAQCGYCQAGQIMAAEALLRAKPNPGDDDIDQAMSPANATRW